MDQDRAERASMALPFPTRHQGICSCWPDKKSPTVRCNQATVHMGAWVTPALFFGPGSWALSSFSLALGENTISLECPQEKEGAKDRRALSYRMKTNSVQAILTYLLGNLQGKNQQEQVTRELKPSPCSSLPTPFRQAKHREGVRAEARSGRRYRTGK